MNSKEQNQTGNHLKIKVRGNEVPPKLVLYGPNGAGKSLILRGLLARVVGHDDVAGMLVDVEGSAASVVRIDEASVVQRGVKVFNKDVVSFGDWGDVAVVDPEVVSRLSVDVYFDKFHDPDRGWQPLSMLSYGQRRRLAIEAALAAADVVLVENFEAGLHVDAVVDLMKRIAERGGAVALETHSGLVLRAAQRYGVPMFYVEPLARLKPIGRLDDSELFARELSAWNAVVV